MKYVEANIETLDGGDAIKMVNHEIGEAIKNCCDPNKDTSAKRKVTLTITLTPHSNRQGIEIEFAAKSTLPGDKPGKDQILLSQSGHAYVNNAHQLALDEMEQDGEIEHINQETGEVTT